LGRVDYYLTTHAMLPEPRTFLTWVSAVNSAYPPVHPARVAELRAQLSAQAADGTQPDMPGQPAADPFR
jgi:hypothetical protein